MEEREEDEERRGLLRNILDLLLAGGYFRARISSLSPFDKLTGGLAWCITASNADVDFDLFYDDDATLGLKIKVGEAIEASLKKMNCPYPLQAHQIQGLDYPAVLPVVQWLVKRVLATREEFSSQLRRVSLMHFKENYEPQNQASFQHVDLEKRKMDRQIALLDCPQRVYRRSKNSPISKDNNERFRCTLQEYGLLQERNPVEHVSTHEPALTLDDPSSKVKNISEKTAQSSESLSILKSPGVRSSLSPFTTSADNQLSGSNVKRVVQLRSEEIQPSSQSSQSDEVKEKSERQVAALLKQIEWQKARIAKLQESIGHLELNLKDLNAKIMQEEDKKRKKEHELNKLEGILEENNCAQQYFSLLEELQSLMNEETHLRGKHEREIMTLEAQKQQLEEKLASSEDVEQISNIEELYKSELENWKTVRAELANKNRSLLEFQRHLDDVPSQTELIQYEYRFVELYLHIQAKLRETRKYYSAYNALAESTELSIKEISLLNSIQSQFEVAMTTVGGQAKLVESMEGILKGVQQKLDKIGTRYRQELSTLANLKEKHTSAISRQRQYSALLKVFQEKYAENESLQKTLDALDSSSLEASAL